MSNPLISTEVNAGVCCLDMALCTCRSAGVYMCIASNRLGRDQTSCKVVVEGIQLTGNSYRKPDATPLKGQRSKHAYTLLDCYLVIKSKVKTCLHALGLLSRQIVRGQIVKGQNMLRRSWIALRLLCRQSCLGRKNSHFTAY